MLISFLQNIGLEETEAKVYLTGLELGNKPASIIAKKAGLKRIRTYNILNRLIKMGLASKSTKAGITYFQVAEPRFLNRFLERQEISLIQSKEKLNELLPQFVSKQSLLTERPRVSFYEGKDGLKEMYEDTLVEDDSTICGFTDFVPILKALPDYINDYFQKRIRRNIKCTFISPENKESLLRQKKGKEELRKLKFIPQKYGHLPAEINVYQDKVAIIAFGAEDNGVIIENKAIADTMRTIWKALWDRLA